MVIGTLQIEIKRTGDQRTLVIVGRPYGIEQPVSLADVDDLSNYLASEATRWRKEQRMSSPCTRKETKP